MKLLLTLVLLAGSATPALAQNTCSQRLRAAVTGEKQILKVNQASYRLAARALAHYRAEFSQVGVYIESVARYLNDGKTVGYKITITDGGDESKVDYILDGSKDLISAYWHNQSPQRYWLCR